MSGYLLCQLPKAKIPYYIKAISTNIYTMEELCFYLYNNVYLVDESIVNEHLCDWIRDELGLKKLYRRLYTELEKKDGMGNFVLPIFKEINYLSHDEFRTLQDSIRKLEAQPEDIRRKMKGDYLVNHEMYTNAINEYHEILSEQSMDSLGDQFYADVWSNMGAAYARLFLFEETAKCYEEAYRHKKSTKNYENYLCALWLSHSETEFQEVIKERGIDYKRVIQLEDKIQEVYASVIESSKYREFQQMIEKDEDDKKRKLSTALDKIMREYKRSTCS
jgi:tetratricopeptide (TPR) repeat protein